MLTDNSSPGTSLPYMGVLDFICHNYENKIVFGVHDLGRIACFCVTGNTLRLIPSQAVHVYVLSTNCTSYRFDASKELRI